MASPAMIFTLTEFRKHHAKGGYGIWYSDKFYNHPGEYYFEFNVFTNGFSGALGTHLTPYLYLQPGANDGRLEWPIKCTMYLQMLNQRGHHGHHTVIHTVEYKTKGYQCAVIGTTLKYFPLAKLGYCADQNTEYLRMTV